MVDVGVFEAGGEGESFIWDWDRHFVCGGWRGMR